MRHIDAACPPGQGSHAGLQVKLAILVATFVLLISLVARAEFPADSESGDFNFDGHSDYRLPSNHPGNQCEWWEYYIYDPSINSHRLIETDFCKEQFDLERKLVISRISGGMAGLIYKIRHFR